MAQLSGGSSRTYYTNQYDSFKGADFSTDSSLVDRKRSPDCLNMISDNGGNPVKRKGWEYWQNIGMSIDNIWDYTDDNGSIIVANAGGNIYAADDNGVTKVLTLSTGAEKRVAINADAGLVVFTSAGLYIIKSDKTYEAITPYVPTILVGCAPSGGGTVNESVNLLTRERIETFNGDGIYKTFTVSGTIDTTKTYSVKVDGVSVTPTVSGKTFTLSTAPATGTGNVVIQYFATGGETNITKIGSARVIQQFAEGASYRWFIAGEDSNIVRYSALGDYTYWADLDYIVVGTSEHKVQGFLPIGEYLGVVKETSTRETALYFAQQTTVTDSTSTVTSDYSINSTSSERYVYKVTPATAGIGAVSHNTFAVLGDEPLFLSMQGIQGVANYSLTSDKTVRNRSMFLNGKLTNEPDLDTAIACTWNGYYVLAVNNHAYVLDSRQKSTDYSGNTSYNYEGYYWDNVPAVCMTVKDSQIYFGTSGGNICRFKTGEYNAAYSDGSKGNVDDADYVIGEAVTAAWSTKDDNDGYPQYRKTMQKKGSLVTVKSYRNSRVDVYMKVDGQAEVFIGTGYVNDWSEGFASIDFTNFVFDTHEGARDKYITKKAKKYMRLKLIVKNEAIEPFGILGITKTYVCVKYAKK